MRMKYCDIVLLRSEEGEEFLCVLEEFVLAICGSTLAESMTDSECTDLCFVDFRWPLWQHPTPWACTGSLLHSVAVLESDRYP